FSQFLSPNSEQKPQLLHKIKQQSPSLHQFKKQFPHKPPPPFPSRSPSLLLNNGQLQILTTPNQHNPLTQGKTPILPL
ncbi:Fe-Mn family superoxide dismutase, partial [Staphylococcus capitis]|uniref:Fe-Mn family superoxide dismutase n=1 Tax=Staphylococcus capitis TaxID=29388 RepID=UPI001C9312DE